MGGNGGVFLLLQAALIQGYKLAILSRGRILLFIVYPNLIAQTISSEVFPNDNNWHYGVVTYDHSLPSDNGIVYLDGRRVGSGTKTGTTPSTAKHRIPIK